MLRALIVGDAKGGADEAGAALAMFRPDAICATNMIGIEWPGRLDYWCTLHPFKAGPWPGMAEALRRRQLAGRNKPQVWAHKVAPGIDRQTDDWAGSTGLLCVKVMRLEQFTRIVLAGVPMSQAGGHYYDDQPWGAAHVFRKGWSRKQRELAPYIRSMSGWTKDLLGAPTEAWLAGTE